MRRLLISLAAVSVLVGAFSPAHAAISDSMIEGAKQCTRQLPSAEREYGIPQHLLTAISITESGRWHKGLNISLPWPWTINAEGKGYFLNSKAEAIATARSLQMRGVRSMDVGCMQVNLMHHPRAFANLDEAFDPERNVKYAASFLRSLYEEQRGWKPAAAAYHSKTPARGAQYVGLVMDRWHTIIDRVRLAGGAAQPIQPQVSQVEDRLPKPQLTQLAALQPAATTPPAVATSAPVFSTPARSEQKPPRAPVYRAASMKKIQVTSVPSAQREHGVLVLRTPTYTSASTPQKLAMNTATQQPTPSTVPAMPKSGPRFIFSN